MQSVNTVRARIPFTHGFFECVEVPDVVCSHREHGPGGGSRPGIQAFQTTRRETFFSAG